MRLAFGLLPVIGMRMHAERLRCEYDEVHGRFEAGNKTSITVDRRVGEREQARCVGEQATDVVARGVGQPGVAHLVVEQRSAVLPETLVAVHARTVVAEEWLGHERRGATVLPRDVLDDVLEEHDLVG